MKNIFIVRHCKAEGQGPDSPLTEIGLQQAYKLAQFFSNQEIDYILSSPYKRAFDTITPLAEKLGIEIFLDDRLAERVLADKNYSEWREMLLKSYDDLELCYEGGESSYTAMQRATSVCRDILNSSYKNTVIVSHGNLISLLLKKFDDRIGFREWEALTNPDVYQLSFINGTVSIKRMWEN